MCSWLVSAQESTQHVRLDITSASAWDLCYPRRMLDGDLNAGGGWSRSLSSGPVRARDSRRVKVCCPVGATSPSIRSPRWVRVRSSQFMDSALEHVVRL
jgi:hypothetical protein